MSPPTTLTHNQLDSATPTFVACNFSAELQVDSVVLARETVHWVKPLCITEVVEPDVSASLQCSQGFTDARPPNCVSGPTQSVNPERIARLVSRHRRSSATRSDFHSAEIPSSVATDLWIGVERSVRVLLLRTQRSFALQRFEDCSAAKEREDRRKGGAAPTRLFVEAALNAAKRRF